MAGKLMIETERLLLREFDEADVSSFYLLGSDPAVMRFLGDRLTSIEQALEVLRTRPIADYRKHGYGRWACIDKASGELIGFSGLKYLDDLQEVDLGYRFLPAYWGRGLATESGRAVLDYGFAKLGLPEIIGLVAPENSASVRVLEKLGFAFVRIIEYFARPTAKYAISAPACR
jgi:RimJ/RimL family protein N-acetyltransferase